MLHPTLGPGQKIVQVPEYRVTLERVRSHHRWGPTSLRLFSFLGLSMSLGVSPAMAQVGPQGPINLTQGTDELREKVRIEQKLDAQLPADLPFTDSTGQSVVLGDYFGERPLVFALVYYECSMLCTMVLNGALRAVNVIDELDIGKDYDVLVVSIDHREPHQLAAAKRHEYAKRYPRPGSKEGWHFLVGTEPRVRRLADTVGFRYFYDEETDQYAHASALMVLTPDGRISKYFYGIDYDPRSLRLAIVEASVGSVGSLVSLADAVTLYCFQYDPATGKYSLAIMRVLQMLAVLTMGSMLTFMVLSSFRDRRKRVTRRDQPEAVT